MLSKTLMRSMAGQGVRSSNPPWALVACLENAWFLLHRLLFVGPVLADWQAERALRLAHSPEDRLPLGTMLTQQVRPYVPLDSDSVCRLDQAKCWLVYASMDLAGSLWVPIGLAVLSKIVG